MARSRYFDHSHQRKLSIAYYSAAEEREIGNINEMSGLTMGRAFTSTTSAVDTNKTCLRGVKKKKNVKRNVINHCRAGATAAVCEDLKSPGV